MSATQLTSTAGIFRPARRPAAVVVAAVVAATASGVAPSLRKGRC